MIEKSQNKFGLFWQLTKRHLMVFFRNKVRVFFTLLVPFIIFVIYIFFLRGLELSTVSSILEEITESAAAEGVIVDLKNDSTLSGYISTLIDSWMLSGIIAICTFTVSLQTNTTIVSDRENGVNRDFASSPISRSLLIFSYFLFNIIVTIIICVIFLLVCLIYLACMGEFMITFVDFLTILASTCFTSVLSVLFTVFICSFIQRDSTMASVNTIFSTAIGFLIGAYMPLSSLPAVVQNICAFIPGTHSCSLLRYAFMSTPLSEMTAYISSLGLPNGEALIESFTSSFGYGVTFFGITLDTGAQALICFIWIIILVALNISFGKKLVTVISTAGKKLVKKKK